MRSVEAWVLKRRLPTAYELEEYFDRRGHRYDCVAAHQVALAAAERGEDRYDEAYAHYGLGRVSHWLGHFEEAQTHLEHALTLFEGLNEKGNAAHAHIDLSHVLEHQNRVPEALRHARRALGLSRATDNRRAQARALEFIGLRMFVVTGWRLQGRDRRDFRMRGD